MPNAALPDQPLDSQNRWIKRLCKWRVRVGFILIVAFVANGLVNHKVPRDISEFTPMLGVAAALILLGTSIRLIALGTLFKNESLATRGIYSLCRHPLYLGSTLLFIGLGIILNSSGYLYWCLGLPYIALFFSAAAINEERFLRQKFGDAFDQYKKSTPAFLPHGHWHRGEFSWARSMHRGGVKLIASVALMIVAMQAMAVIFPKL